MSKSIRQYFSRGFYLWEYVKIVILISKFIFLGAGCYWDITPSMILLGVLNVSKHTSM